MSDDMDQAEETFIDTQEMLVTFEQHGINMQDILKLKNSGICTILGVAQTTRKNLLKIKAKVEKLKPPTFATAAEISIKREVSKILLNRSPGAETDRSPISECLLYHDWVKVRRCDAGRWDSNAKYYRSLWGIPNWQGLYSALISSRHDLIFNATRQTQLCHTMCVTTQLPMDMGGASGKVAYIDTEGTFRPDRVKAIAERFGVDAKTVAEFVDDRSYKLLIVDSVMNLFRSDYTGRGELSERQQKLNQFLSRLAKVAEEFNIAVLMTNQASNEPPVQADPGAAAMFAAASSAKPIGGHVLAHASATRMQLRKGRGDERIAKLVRLR
ncbi:hypothetical protein QFC20_004286 [Naganishia adeliensis]|uniref:Uncharacterized protein n=1 Tax=Naganishia adeliensis TaxID=92952 RepID=A0ACC2W2K1_9TREE|nr:hypothetical protein QFC20_004286 [Naganishia adeliensis]